MNQLFVRFCVSFGSALGKALVREAAWMTVKAARQRIESRDRYCRQTNTRPAIDMEQRQGIWIPKDEITYGP
ncbi:MAG: hypothetical protein DRQ98_13105 [Gammaproteobacteria bacterium]|nr:MAG: hypothetical protein DRQ98_13105 [Gammaproteobacteria bacterium]